MTTKPLPQISCEHSEISAHSVHVSTRIYFRICSSRNERLLRLLYQQLHLSTYQESFTGWNNQWCFTLRENINLALGRGFSRMVVRALQSGGSNHAGLFSLFFLTFPTAFASGVSLIRTLKEVHLLQSVVKEILKWMPLCAAWGKIGSITSDWVKNVASARGLNSGFGYKWCSSLNCWGLWSQDLRFTGRLWLSYYLS